MKKLTLLLLILCAVEAWASPPGFMAVATSGGAAGTDCAGYRFKWEATSTTAECFDADDGGTVSLTSVELNGGVAVINATTDKISFPATHGNNISADDQIITMRYRMVGGTAPSWAAFFSHSSTVEWTSQRDSTSTSAVRYNSNGYVSLNPAINIYDGNWHVLTWEHHRLTPQRKFCVDGTCAESATVFTAPTLSSGSLYIGSNAPESIGLIGEIDYVYIQ